MLHLVLIIFFYVFLDEGSLRLILLPWYTFQCHNKWHIVTITQTVLNNFTVFVDLIILTLVAHVVLYTHYIIHSKAGIWHILCLKYMIYNSKRKKLALSFCCSGILPLNSKYDTLRRSYLKYLTKICAKTLTKSRISY